MPDIKALANSKYTFLLAGIVLGMAGGYAMWGHKAPASGAPQPGAPQPGAA